MDQSNDTLYNEKADKRREKALKLRMERAALEFEQVLSTPQGRATIWRILEVCKVHGASFTGDPERTFFREGQRNIGQQILAMFDDIPGDKGHDLMHLMTVEAKRRERGEDD